MFHTSRRPALSRAPFAALLAAAALTAGCLEQPYPAAAGETQSALVVQNAGELAQQIAAHPSYAQLSDLADRDISRVSATFAVLPQQQAVEALDSLSTCHEQGDVVKCETILDTLGLMTAEDKQARALASAAAAQIAADLGLAELSSDEVVAGFRGAQIMSDGVGAGSDLIDLVLAKLDAPCGADCRESLGHHVGSDKGEYTAALVVNDNSNRGIVRLALYLGNIIIVGPWDWPSSPGDECMSDNDCDDDEYCHKIGVNDCRPARSLDALCTRGGQCASNCCKPHISAGFLPICRPADRC